MGTSVLVGLPIFLKCTFDKTGAFVQGMKLVLKSYLKFYGDKFKII
jgi:hypothetical protein